MYDKQEYKTQKIIQEEIYEYEQKISREIKESEDSGRKMWKYINEIEKGKEKEDGVRLHEEDGKELEKHSMRKEVEKFCIDKIWK